MQENFIAAHCSDKLARERKSNLKNVGVFCQIQYKYLSTCWICFHDFFLAQILNQLRIWFAVMKAKSPLDGCVTYVCMYVCILNRFVFMGMRKLSEMSKETYNQLDRWLHVKIVILFWSIMSIVLFVIFL